MTGGHFACSGCQPVLGEKLALLALGKDVIMVNTAGCMTLTATYPFTPYKECGWVHGAIENGASVGSGLYHGLKALGKKSTVLIYAGDGASYDIGIQSLLGAIYRKDEMIYVCYNNANYANTGHQVSSATDYGAVTKTTPIGKKNKVGNVLPRKNLCKLVGSHGCEYAATACTSYPVDFMEKLKKSKKFRGVKVIDLLGPCIPGWGIKDGDGQKIGRLMVESWMWPLYEIEDGKFKLNYKPKKIHVKNALDVQKRFSHLSKSEIEKIERNSKKERSLLLKGKFWEV